MIMNLNLKKIGNQIFLFDDDVIFKVWYEYDFTEWKLKNALEKIRKTDPEKRDVELCRI